MPPNKTAEFVNYFLKIKHNQNRHGDKMAYMICRNTSRQDSSKHPVPNKTMKTETFFDTIHTGTRDLLLPDFPIEPSPQPSERHSFRFPMQYSQNLQQQGLYILLTRQDLTSFLPPDHLSLETPLGCIKDLSKGTK